MLKKILHYIRSFPPLRLLILLAHKTTFPGLPGVSLSRVATEFYKGLTKTNLSQRADAITYNFIMAFFPAIIFLFTLSAYLPIPNFEETLLSAIEEVLPPFSFLAVKNTIIDIVSLQRGGLLSLGFVLAMFYANNALTSVISAFNSTIHFKDQRPDWKIRLVALMLTVVLSLLLIVSAGLMISVNIGLNYLFNNLIIISQFELFLIWFVKWIVFYALIFFSVAFLYYFGPAITTRGRFFSAGASVTSFLFMLLIIGFGYFVSNFGTYNTVYGSVGTLIAILVLINLSSYVLLAGYEFNASVYHLRSVARKNKKTGLTH